MDLETEEENLKLETMELQSSTGVLICRLCANESDKFIGLYSEEGLSNELATKINQYLPVKVCENDVLPLQCCLACASTLLSWHELFVTCVEAEQRFITLQSVDEEIKSVQAENDDYQDVEPEPDLDIEPDLDMEPDGETDFDNELDPDEPKAMTSQTEAMMASEPASLNVLCQTAAHNKTTPINKMLWLKQEPGQSDNIMVNVNDLEGTYSKKIVIKKDMLKSYQYEIDDEDNAFLHHDVDIPSDQKVINDVMDSLNTDTSDTRKVVRKVAKKSDKMKIVNEDNSDFEDAATKGTDNLEIFNYVCRVCSANYSTEEAVVIHIKKEHQETTVDKELQIKKERKKTTKIDQEAINAAKVVVDGKVYYNCKICGKSLHSPYTYIWHMRIHTGERPFVCDLCGKQFRVSQGLVRHLKETHEGIKNFPCDLCGRMFATRRNVEEHRRIHTNERPYICALCGKSFKQKASLFVHNRSHNNSFPHRCSYCNQGFRTRPPLLLHITRHTGEKPYPCNECGRCFRIKYELKRHMLIHSDEKPFVCGDCGANFRQKRYLRNHTRINHNRETP